MANHLCRDGAAGHLLKAPATGHLVKRVRVWLELTATVGAPLEGDWQSDWSRVDWDDGAGGFDESKLVAGWALLRGGVVSLLSKAGNPQHGGGIPLSLGRYGHGDWQPHDLDTYDLSCGIEYSDHLPLTIDTSGLAGKTVSRAVLRVYDPGKPDLGVGITAAEQFAFGAFDGGAVQHDGDRDSGTPDGTDATGAYWDFEIAAPDAALNKAGDTVLQLRYRDPVTADPTGWNWLVTPDHTVGDYNNGWVAGPPEAKLFVLAD